jgi:hypothetical protein
MKTDLKMVRLFILTVVMLLCVFASTAYADGEICQVQKICGETYGTYCCPSDAQLVVACTSWNNCESHTCDTPMCYWY